jgi:hypothetical protein
MKKVCILLVLITSVYHSTRFKNPKTLPPLRDKLSRNPTTWGLKGLSRSVQELPFCRSINWPFNSYFVFKMRLSLWMKLKYYEAEQVGSGLRL